MEQEILEIAKEAQLNAEAEAKAVKDYTEMIAKILESNLDIETKNTAVDVIKELISDELNHEMRLGELYVALTGIEPNKN